MIVTLQPHRHRMALWLTGARGDSSSLIGWLLCWHLRKSSSSSPSHVVLENIQAHETKDGGKEERDGDDKDEDKTRLKGLA